MSSADSENISNLSYNQNKKYYDMPGVPDSYAGMTNLLKAEEVILSHLYDEIKDKALLDIGVGPGRTTPYLRAISQNYTGTDYSENMLAPCRAKYADANLVLCDARRMTLFKDGSFDAVFFCWNAIDDADPADRILILREIHRVLKKNGVFVFSAHNFDAKNIPAFEFPELAFARNPARLLKQNAASMRVYLSGILQRMTNRKAQALGYSVIIEYESRARCVVPTYYIRKEAQIRQLEEVGFHDVKALDKDGRFICSERYRDYWYIYYFARKK